MGLKDIYKKLVGAGKKSAKKQQKKKNKTQPRSTSGKSTGTSEHRGGSNAKSNQTSNRGGSGSRSTSTSGGNRPSARAGSVGAASKGSVRPKSGSVKPAQSKSPTQKFNGTNSRSGAIGAASKGSMNRIGNTKSAQGDKIANSVGYGLGYMGKSHAAKALSPIAGASRAPQIAAEKAGTGHKAGQHTPTKNERKNGAQDLVAQRRKDENAKKKAQAEAVKSGDYKSYYTATYQRDEKGNIVRDKNGNAKINVNKKGATGSNIVASQSAEAKIKEAKKKLKNSAEGDLEKGAQSFSDEKKEYDIPFYTKHKQKEAKEDARKRYYEAKTSIDKSKESSVRAYAKDFDNYIRENGWDENTVLNVDGKEVSVSEYRKQYLNDRRKELEEGSKKQLNEYKKSLNEETKNAGKVNLSGQDIYKGSVEMANEMVDYLVPYMGTTKLALKAADAAINASKIGKAGKVLTKVTEKGGRELSKSGKEFIRNEIANGIKSGKATDAILADTRKKIMSSNRFNSIGREVLANAMQDASIGTAIDLAKGVEKGYKGEELEDWMKTSAALNLALGAPVSAIAGRTGKAGKRALTAETKNEINSSFAKVTKLDVNEGSELLSLHGKQNSVGLTSEEGKRLAELQDKVLSSHGGIARMDKNGRLVATDGKSVKNIISPSDVKELARLQAKQSTGTLRGEDLDSFVKLSKKVEDATTAVQQNAETVLKLGKKKNAEIDRADIESSVNFYKRIGDDEKAEEAQRILDADIKRCTERNESLNKAMDTMSEKTGIQYRFVDNDEMSAAIGKNSQDNVFVRGVTTKDNDGNPVILINRDAPQAHQTIIGHETGHLIKDSNEEEFDKLGNMLKDYSVGKGEYEAFEKEMLRNYPELKNDPKALKEEMSCELLGRYIFGDDDKFIKRLAGEHPSAFERIVEYIRNLAVKVTNPDLAKQLSKISDRAEELVGGISPEKSAEATKIRASKSTSPVDFSSPKTFDPSKPREMGVVDSNGTVTKRAEEAYKEAISSGDTETQKRLVEAVANERFKDSKLRDSDGNLVPMYHSTISGRFNVFDKNKANPEGNSGAGFYFSSSRGDSASNYGTPEGADITYKIQRRADEIMDIVDSEGEYNGRAIKDWDEARDVAEDEMYVGSEEYVTYLNTRNPVYVGKYGDNNETNMLDSLMDGYETSLRREDYDDEWEFEDALWDERADYAYSRVDDIAEDISDVADGEDWQRVFESVRDSINECLSDGRMTYDDLKEALNRQPIHYYNEEGQDTINEIARAVSEKLGYDAIIDSKVSDKFGGMEGIKEGDFHAIVFKPEQIKEVSMATRDDSGRIISLSERFDTTNPDIRFSKSVIDPSDVVDSSGKVKKEASEAYMRAAESGDEAQAQKFVDAKLKAQGYTRLAYHGSDSFGFTKFNMDKAEVGAIFTAKDITTSETYTRNPQIRKISDANNGEVGGIYRARLKMKNPLTVNVRGNDWSEIPPEAFLKNGESYTPKYRDDYEPGEDYFTADVAEYARDNGYDGVVFKDIYDEGEYVSRANDTTDVYVVFDSSQFKSADAITRDDNGNIIPLEKRGDASEPDIRYSKEAKTDENAPVDFNGVKTFDPRKPRARGSAKNPVEFQKASDFDVRAPRTEERGENPVEFKNGASDFDVRKPRTNERGENPADFRDVNTFNPKQARRGASAEPPESPARFTKPGEEREASLEGIRDKRYKKEAPPEKSLDDTISEYSAAQKELSDFYKKYKGKDATKSNKYKEIQSRIDDAFKQFDEVDNAELMKAISKAEDDGVLSSPIAGSLRSRVLRNAPEPEEPRAVKGKTATKTAPKAKTSKTKAKTSKTKKKEEVAPGEVKDDIKSVEGMTQEQLRAEAAGTQKHLTNAIKKYGEDAPRVKQLRDHLNEVETAIKKEPVEPEGGYAKISEDELPKGLRKGETAEENKKPFVFKEKKAEEVTFEDFNKAVEDGRLAGISETKDQRTVVEKALDEAGKAREAYDKAIELLVDDLHAFEALGRSIKNKAARERFLAQTNQLRVSKRMGRAYTEDIIDPLYRKHGLVGKMHAEKRDAYEKYVFLKHNADRIKKGTDIYGGIVDEAAIQGARNDINRFEVGINDLKKQIEQREKLQLPPDPYLEKGIKNYEAKIAKAEKRIEKLTNEGIQRNNAILKDIEKRYPDVKDFQKSVVEFADSLNKMDLEAGIIGRTGKNGYDTLKKDYPNYVPTYRNKAYKAKDAEGKEMEELGFEDLLELSTFEEIDIAKGMRRAKGGDDDLVPLYNQLVAKANMVAKRTEQNRLAQMIADVTGDLEPHEIPSNLSLKDALEAIPKTYEKDGKHGLIYFVDGKAHTVEISASMAREMRRWSGEEKISILGYRLGSDPLTKAVSPIARTFKSAITDWNVLFGAKNFVRDQQTAWLYTKDLKGYIAAYPKVCAALMPEKVARMLPKKFQPYFARYRRIYRAYMDNGGKYSPLVRTDGVRALENWRKGNPLKWASDFNAVLETFPRMQEFTATIDADVKKLVKGGMDRDEAYNKVLSDHDIMSKAMYRSKDVTLNFDRGGTIGRWLNSSLVPFFNPAIQGLSKVARFLAVDNKSATDYVKMMGFLSIGVVAPGALWELRFGEDEDYKSLTNYYKDNYYCLPVGDGKFIKIPKARELGALQNPIDHMIRHTEFGQPGDWKEMFKLGYEQIGPVSPISDNLIAPLYRAYNNKNWFGGQIENRYDQKLIAQGKSDEVFDEKTSLLAIKLGKQKALKDRGISPKKIDNMMDSYLGVFYDMGIGQFNQSNDSNDPTSKKLLDTGKRILDTNFVVDSYISNKYAGKLYDKESELNQKIDDAEKGTQAYRDAVAAKRRFDSNYSYDNMTYQQAIADVKSMNNLSSEKKNELVRRLKYEQRQLQADSYNGKKKSDVDVYDTLLDVFKLNKTIEEYSYTSKNAQGKETNALRDAWRAYKKSDEYKKNGGKKFKQMFNELRDLNSYVGESKTNVDYDSTAFVIQHLKSKGKDTDALTKAFDVWESSQERADKYFNDMGGTLDTYKKTHKKVVEASIRLGYDYTNQIDDAEKAVALAQGDTIDRGYYAEKVDRKTNAARCVVMGHNWTDQRLSTWAASHNIDCKKCDNWSKYKSGKCSPDYVKKCIEKDSKEKTREGKAALFALYFPYEENPFGEIGDYSLDGDTGVDGGGKGGYGHGRRRGRRGGRRGGHGGGGGSGSGATMPTTASGAIKGKVTNPFGKVSDYRITSNLDDAYRKKAKKLREANRKKLS